VHESGGGTSDCADEVILARKRANSPTRGRKLRSTGTKARVRVGRNRKSREDLEMKLVRLRRLASGERPATSCRPSRRDPSNRFRVLPSTRPRHSRWSVPMLKENRLVGAINIYRQQAQAFTDKQIELVSNFGTFSAASHRRSTLRSPAFASSMIVPAIIASLRPAGRLTAARAVSKATPTRRVVSGSKVSPFKKGLMATGAFPSRQAEP